MFSYLEAVLLFWANLARGAVDYDYEQNGDDWPIIHNGKYAGCGSGD